MKEEDKQYLSQVGMYLADLFYNQNKMEQTAVEWLVNEMVERNFFAKDTPLSYTTLEHLTNQAKAMDRSQKAEEYLKGFKDGKEYQIKLDELTFKSE